MTNDSESERIAAEAEPEVPFDDTFRGDNAHLLACTRALLALDAKNALVPHGLGGHARDLLNALASRLKAAEAAVERLNERNVELSVHAHKWMVAHDMLKAGKPYDYPTPTDVPDLLAEVEKRLREGWRPIETAPKDGTSVLLFKSSGLTGMTVGNWRRPMSSRTPGYWQTTPGLYACEPSHWQPLPAPPAPDFRRAASALRGER